MRFGKPAQAAVQNQQEVSVAVERSLGTSVYDGMIVNKSLLQGVPLQQSPSPTLDPRSSSNPTEIVGSPSQDVPNDRFSGEGVRPKDSACLDLYVSDGKGSRLSQMGPKFSGMLSHTCNLLFIIRLQNLMEKFGTPFFRVDRITSELHVMEATSMTLISERATIMPQASTFVGVISQYPSQVSQHPFDG